jgi:hypothetical protein
VLDGKVQRRLDLVMGLTAGEGDHTAFTWYGVSGEVRRDPRTHKDWLQPGAKLYRLTAR